MITNLSAIRALAKGKLIIAVNAARTAEDPFKLPADLLTLVQTGVGLLESGDTDTHHTEGQRAGASAHTQDAYDKLETALRLGYTGIGAIIGRALLPTGITDADRLAVYTTYGWEEEKLGRFTGERLLVLGELAVQGITTISEPTWRYSSSLTTIIQAQLDLIESTEPTAATGDRQLSVAARNTLLDQLETYFSRVRYYYCSASDELDMTKELARISFQPRRPKGTVAQETAAHPPAPPAA